MAATKAKAPKTYGADGATIARMRSAEHMERAYGPKKDTIILEPSEASDIAPEDATEVIVLETKRIATRTGTKHFPKGEHVTSIPLIRALQSAGTQLIVVG